MNYRCVIGSGEGGISGGVTERITFRYIQMYCVRQVSSRTRHYPLYKESTTPTEEGMCKRETAIWNPLFRTFLS